MHKSFTCYQQINSPFFAWLIICTQLFLRMTLVFAFILPYIGTMKLSTISEVLLVEIVYLQSNVNWCQVIPHWRNSSREISPVSGTGVSGDSRKTEWQLKMQVPPAVMRLKFSTI